MLMFNVFERQQAILGDKAKKSQREFRDISSIHMAQITFEGTITRTFSERCLSCACS
jgi:hypothetical protein